MDYDCIVIANTNSADTVQLKRKTIYLPLAKNVAGEKEGNLAANYFMIWSDIDASLPKTRLQVFGSPQTSGTRHASVELAMEGGCETIPWIKALKNENNYRVSTLRFMKMVLMSKSEKTTT
jgi:phosphate transport system substrate-binding protein